MQTGIDIVKIDRLAKYQDDEKFLNKYFSKTEVEYIKSKQNGLQTLAGLYACKEAVLKALGIGIGAGIDLKEISINHNKNGMPYVEIDAKLQYYLNLLNCKDISISISHDGDYAIAICVVV